MADTDKGLIRWVLCLDRRHPLKPGLWMVVLVAGLNAAMMALGCYDRFELVDLDRANRSSSQSPAKTSLVLISDEDYDAPGLFAGKSPLAASKVVDLVKAVCDFEPAVVAVDLLTSEWTGNDQQEAIARLSALSHCRTVWVRDAIAETDPASAHEIEPSRFRLGKVVGEDGPPQLAYRCPSVRGSADPRNRCRRSRTRLSHARARQKHGERRR